MPDGGLKIIIDRPVSRDWFSNHPVPTLREIAAVECGLRPISEETLRTHIEMQERRYPASWAYHHQGLMTLLTWLFVLPGCVLVLMGIVVAGANILLVLKDLLLATTTVHYYWWNIAIGVGYLCLGGGMVAAGGTYASCGIKGPPYWSSRGWMTLDAVKTIVPPQVAAAAQRLDERARVSFIYYELLREKVVLDPYLVAVSRADPSDRVVLGIWDGKTVIDCA